MPWVYVLRLKNPRILFYSAHISIDAPWFSEVWPSLTPPEHSPSGLSVLFTLDFGLRSFKFKSNPLEDSLLSSYLLIISGHLKHAF